MLSNFRISESVPAAWILLAVAFVGGVSSLAAIAHTEVGVVQKVFFGATVSVLIFGAIGHLLAHLGYVQRLAKYRRSAPVSQSVPGSPPTIGFLIPSLREEPDFIYRSILSCAFQTHSDAWIRLLIDDPAASNDPEHQTLRRAAIDMPDKVRTFLAPFADDAMHASRIGSSTALENAHERLAMRFQAAADNWPLESHEDRLFSRLVLMTCAEGYAARAAALRDEPLSPGEARAEARALYSRFTRDIGIFERKRYANLSHAANKAMNLNSYIGLMGRRLVEEESAGALILRDCTEAGIFFPDAPFLVTLDADSQLHPDYSARLLAIMLHPGHERVAVVQTPYSAVPGAPGSLEDNAGATTDVQRILHQGYCHFGAAFWVGANAVLRKSALEDIRQFDFERGYLVTRFIQDRTVIEDTESTIDLAAKGWALHNHMEILAYSATPKDFGSLMIQRRRWACGGLLIFPKAARLFLSERESAVKRLSAAVIRANYLTSLALVPAAIIILAFVPFDDALGNVFLLFVAVSYFFGYALDLELAGRPARTLLAVYGLNLLLIPVNLSGAIASVRQGFTGKRPPFQRTPKVEGRTASDSFILSSIWIGAFATAAVAIYRIFTDNLAFAALNTVNAAALIIATTAFIGVAESIEDISAVWRRDQGPK